MVKKTNKENQQRNKSSKNNVVDPIIWLRRIIIYTLGLFILALGVAFSIQSKLGVSPVSSLPYALSIVAAIDVGLMTTIVFSTYVLIQVFILRRKFPLKHLFQVLVASLFGYFVSLSMTIIGSFNPTSYIARFSFLGVSLVLIAVGIIFYLTADLIPMPAEGLILSVNKVTKIPFGKGKIIFDVTSVSLAALLLIIFNGEIVGLREGTLIAALGVGKLIGIFSKWIKSPLSKFCMIEPKIK
jgi:uncharacterized membrane protein YczE